MVGRGGGGGGGGDDGYYYDLLHVRRAAARPVRRKRHSEVVLVDAPLDDGRRKRIRRMGIDMMCCHVLHCPHDGRVKVLHATISLMDQWMKQSNTDPDLRDCIYEYATGRGRLSMEEICIEND